jgi:hypothetical protein
MLQELRLRDDAIVQHADAFDLDFHHVSRL